MFKAVDESKQLGLPKTFDNLRISGGKDKQRVAFAPDFVQSKILAEGVFADLNPEARRFIYLVAETGLRLSEACNLSCATIRLDTTVPHIQVRPEGREIKTGQSQRDIPLVGVALMAMREQPDGFPRYRDKADSLSALVNQALDARKLRPEPGQSLYSLRHTFEDRLTAVEAPEKLVASLMGHKWHPPAVRAGSFARAEAAMAQPHRLPSADNCPALTAWFIASQPRAPLSTLDACREADRVQALAHAWQRAMRN